MAKQKRITPPSRKQMARIERENLYRRIIIYSTIAVVAVTVLLVGYGVLKAKVLDLRQPIVTVNGDKVSVAEFQARARFQRLQLVNQYSSYYQFMVNFTDENTRPMIENSLRQIQFQLEPAFLGAQMLDEVITDLLVRQEAQKRGITVTPEEVERYIGETFFMYYPDGTPTPIPTLELVPTSTLSPLQLTLVAYTPTPTAEPTTEVTPTPTEAVTPTETAPTTAPPTPTPYTAEQYAANLAKYVDFLQTTANLTEADLRTYAESVLYRQKLMDELAQNLPESEEQVWARHILVASEEEAQAVLERLNAGEDFAALAQELSTDTTTAERGGDLGWFSRGEMVEPFEAVAFALQIGQISEPVQSDFGWHIIQVLGHEERPVSPLRRDTLQQQAFNAWLDEARAAAEIETNPNWSDYVPTEPAIPPELQLP
ncbi:MAG: hypothetical protein D6803_05015 [Anaerolineae bacterium]|nr:MAG: hypothetical protein D6803_05015 [Anaerolineae bacterium]